MEKDLTERLAACYTGAVYDVLQKMGFPNQILPNTISPLNINCKIAGKIFTIEGRAERALDEYTSLLKWCEMLSAAPADSVLICQPNDNTVAHMGELSAETLSFKKVKGYIVDGGCRDSGFIEKINFPVFCRYYTPKDIVAAWMPTAMGEPVKIGEVSIHKDDYVLADRDGVIIIPKEVIEDLVMKTEEVLNTENLVRKAILQGVDPVKAYLEYGKF